MRILTLKGYVLEVPIRAREPVCAGAPVTWSEYVCPSRQCPKPQAGRMMYAVNDADVECVVLLGA